MQPVKINILTPLTRAELFFVEKSGELLLKDTIDTYRLRLNNPRTILLELIQIISLIENKSLKDKYGKVLAEEAVELLREEEILGFSSINKGYALKVLSSTELKSIFYI